MKKIDFVNGTTIDGAKTFNDMQSNVEEVFNGAEPMGSIVVEDVIGKNLFNKDDVIDGYYWTSTGLRNDSSMCSTNSFIEVEPNTLYTTSCDTLSTIFILEYDENKKYIKSNNFWDKREQLITTSSTTRFVTLSVFKIVKDTTQFEKGTKTDYKPYKKFGYNKDESMGEIKVDDIIGKNLLPISESETITLSKSFYFDKPLQPGTYRISVDSVSSTGTKGVYLFNFTRSDGVDGYYFYLEDGNLTEAVTIGAECKGVTIYSQQDWATSNGKTTTFNKAMITKGSSSTKYVPYTKYGYNKDKNMGKILVGDISCNNLFNEHGSLSDYEGWTSGATTLQSNGTIKATANIANGNGKGQFIKVKPNTKYTMSFRVIEMETTGTYNVRIRTVGLETNTTLYTYENTSTGYKTFTFTTNECNTIWVSICGINNASSVNTFKYVIYDEFQLEKGTIATEYAPYKEFGNKQIYSTNEQIVGTWTDGRTLYRKVLIGATTEITTGTITPSYLPISNEDLGEVFIEWGRVLYNGIRFSMPYTASSGYIQMYEEPQFKRVTVVSNTSIFSNCQVVVSILYTKNTQSASTMSLRPDTTEMEETLEETE